MEEVKFVSQSHRQQVAMLGMKFRSGMQSLCVSSFICFFFFFLTISALSHKK